MSQRYIFIILIILLLTDGQLWTNCKCITQVAPTTKTHARLSGSHRSLGLMSMKMVFVQNQVQYVD